MWGNRWEANAITSPPHSGSLYQNYKGLRNIVLMAIVGANYEVLMFDLGEYGRKSDGGISASYVYAKRLRLEN